jgi:hypothetical protein
VWDINPDALQTESSAKLRLGGFGLNELELLQFLQTNYLRDLKKSPGQFDRADCVSDERGLVIELKCRRSHYNELLIEKHKFDALVLKADALNYQAVYINSTPLGIYGWNLSSQEIVWQSEPMPSTTDFLNANTIDKIVGYLPISKAINLAGGGRLLSEMDNNDCRQTAQAD